MIARVFRGPATTALNPVLVSPALNDVVPSCILVLRLGLIAKDDTRPDGNDISGVVDIDAKAAKVLFAWDNLTLDLFVLPAHKGLSLDLSPYPG